MLIAENKPFFLITIDTEGDNLWTCPKKITTNNAKFLPRFQELCENYGFKPTYLTNYEMSISPIFQEFGKRIIKANSGEIGMHLHAWNTPPLHNLTENDYKNQPYLIEYPIEIIKKKIIFLNTSLKKIFRTNIYSHRAGRWSFNEIYAQILIENDYYIDCSVTPHISWQNTLGDPNQKGGTNYINFPEESYNLNLDYIYKKGKSKLLEVPVTIIDFENISQPLSQIIHKIKKKLNLNTYYWFRPKKNNLKSMLQILKFVIAAKKDYIQFVLHSSELMPGGSPTFKNEKDIERLYKNVKKIFEHASKFFIGCTLKEFYENKTGESI